MSGPRNLISHVSCSSALSQSHRKYHNVKGLKAAAQLDNGGRPSLGRDESRAPESRKQERLEMKERRFSSRRVSLGAVTFSGRGHPPERRGRGWGGSVLSHQPCASSAVKA